MAQDDQEKSQGAAAKSMFTLIDEKIDRYQAKKKAEKKKQEQSDNNNSSLF